MGWYECHYTEGVHIGEGCVIGAGAIISKSIPAFSIVTNSGGINIRPRFSPEQIEIHKSEIKQYE